MRHSRSGERRDLEDFKPVSPFSTEQGVNGKKCHVTVSVGLATPVPFL